MRKYVIVGSAMTAALFVLATVGAARPNPRAMVVAPQRAIDRDTAALRAKLDSLPSLMHEAHAAATPEDTARVHSAMLKFHENCLALVEDVRAGLDPDQWQVFVANLHERMRALHGGEHAGMTATHDAGHDAMMRLHGAPGDSAGHHLHTDTVRGARR